MADLDVDGYRTLYVAESRENHEIVVACLLELERGEGGETAINEIFRSVHSLKGMSASMGFDDMEAVCHALEDVFSQIRNGTLAVTHSLMDVLLAGADDIEMMIDEIEKGGFGLLPDKKARVASLQAWIPADSAQAPLSSLPVPKPLVEEEEDFLHSYSISVKLSDAIDSKNLRGMLLLRNFESLGTIISTSPDRETIEDDPSFTGAFELVLSSDAGDEALEMILSAQYVASFVIHPASRAPVSPQVSKEALTSAPPSMPLPASPRDVARYAYEITLSDTVDSKNLRAMVFLQNLTSFGTIISTSPDRETIEDESSFSGFFSVVIESSRDVSVLESLMSSSDIAHYSEISENAGTDSGVTIALPPLVIPKTDSKVRPAPVPAPVPASVVTPPSPDPAPAASTTVREEKTREVKNIRVGIDKLDQMMNLVEDLVINRGRLEQIAQRHKIKELDETLSMIGRSVAKLQDMMMEIRMIPLNKTFNRFPRTVRDIANRGNKEVDFIIKGGETELDRSVMEGLNDPLLHLIRNGIDHGIESPDVRIACGKDPKGILKLEAFRDKDNVVITIEDDGAGMDPDRIRKKALEKGVISRELLNEMSDADVINLVFYPGFSTRDKITDISGRGVGLDVVKTTIAELQGSINLSSELGKGSKFELILPPTMAIVMVMMVQINARRCAIPIANVVEVASLSAFPIQNIGRGEGILMRDEIILLYRLCDMFGRSDHEEIVVVIQSQNKKGAIAVDTIEGQQEVVIKPLSKFVGVCAGISGVTIPGDGEVVPVLDVSGIFAEYGK